MRLRPIPLLVALLACLAAATPAHAARSLEVGIADDAALNSAPDDAAAAALAATWAAQGIDVVRIFAQFDRVAPAPASTDFPAGFNPADPGSPGYDWRLLDRAVNVVRANGMGVILTVTGPVPFWATAQPSRRSGRYRPRPDRFAQFARAVALRYGKDADRYIVWNEPNLPLWLQPQFTCARAGRTCAPESPAIYRSLFRAAAPALRLADPGARVLFGALAPRGNSPTSRNANMRPLTWLRSLACVNDQLRKLRRGTCRGFRPITADGLAYHPHSVKRAPDEPNPRLDEAAAGDVTRLEGVVDGAQRVGGLRKRGAPGRFPLYFTEYGYQTNPPDRFDGVSPAKQATFLQQAAYIFWRDPRVRSFVQYEWRDEPLGRGTSATTDRSRSGWQSGLLFADGRPKPALASFPDPFWVDLPAGARVATLWGQVRPGETHVVTVQLRRAGTWRTVRKVTTDARGSFLLRRTVRSRTDFRFTWVDKDPYSQTGPTRVSAAMRATPRRLPRAGRRPTVRPLRR